MGSAGPVLLMAFGALPGVVGLAFAIHYWRRNQALAEEQIRFWGGVGYLYLAVFVVTGVVVTNYYDEDPIVMALGWIGTPFMAGVLGVWTFAERQRLTLAEFPGPKHMRSVAATNRQEVRLTTTELSNNLNRCISARQALARGIAIGRTGLGEEQVSNLIGRLRQSIGRLSELDARYTIYLRRLRPVAEDDAYDEFPLTEEQQAVVNELRAVHHELLRSYDKILDQAAEVSLAVDRAIGSVAFTQEPFNPS